MRFLAILNRDGGTLRTTDLDAFGDQMRETLEAAGHELRIEIVGGKEIVSSLKRASKDEWAEVVLAGGGDGTISAAAAQLMNGDKALALLPAGTMNLFARGLGLPLSLSDAVAVFAAGKERSVDVGTANGRPFIHQFSIGLHARLVQLRARFEYGSRWGKMLASLRAGLAAMADPPSMRVTLEMDGKSIDVSTTGIGVSNNVFGDGHLPYADEPDGGVLGVYVAKAATRADLAWVFLAMSAGRWSATDKLETHQARNVKLTIRSPIGRHRCVIDGELCTLERDTVVEIHPGVLRVLVPSEVG
jgi:diacylglycerol kinase family enzyme